MAAAAESAGAVARANGKRRLQEDLTTTELEALISTAFNVNSIVNLVDEFVAAARRMADER